MSAATPLESELFGYLTVVDDPAHGSCGGYLVINQYGRPVEFHCTAAVSPSRAQQILYGPTLRASVYGEQVAPALVSKAKSQVAIVLVNQSECLEVQRHTGQRVVLINEGPESAVSSEGARKAHVPGDNARSESQRFLFPEMQTDRRLSIGVVCEEVKSLLQLLAETIDLTEPFSRIREAIYEVQQIGGEGQGSNARAA
jgi:hypothetical protein